MRSYGKLGASFWLSFLTVCLILVSCQDEDDAQTKVIAGLCRTSYPMEKPPSSWQEYCYHPATVWFPAEFLVDKVNSDRIFPVVFSDGFRSIKMRFGLWELGSFDFDTGKVAVCFTQTLGSRALVWRSIDQDSITIHAWYLTCVGDHEFFIEMSSPDTGDEELFLRIAQSVIIINPHHRNSSTDLSF